MKHSPNGKLIALTVNYHKKSLSRILFLSPQCNVMTAISPYGEKKDYGRYLIVHIIIRMYDVYVFMY